MSLQPRQTTPSWLRYDGRICQIANHWGDRRMVVQLFGLISRLGDGVFWYALMLALLMTGGDRGASASLHMAAVGGVALALYRYLKHLTRRPRPFRQHVDIIARIAPLDEFSFPSGHTLHAVSFSAVAIAYVPVLAWGLVPFATMVAASRVVLGLHYPSDVLAASVIGIVLARASFWLIEMVAILL